MRVSSSVPLSNMSGTPAVGCKGEQKHDPDVPPFHKWRIDIPVANLVKSSTLYRFDPLAVSQRYNPSHGKPLPRLRKAILQHLSYARAASAHATKG